VELNHTLLRSRFTVGLLHQQLIQPSCYNMVLIS